MLYKITVVHHVIASSEKEAIQTLVKYESDYASGLVLGWEGKVATISAKVSLVSETCNSVREAPK